MKIPLSLWERARGEGREFSLSPWVRWERVGVRASDALDELRRLYEEHLSVPAPRGRLSDPELLARVMRYDVKMVQAVRALLRGETPDRGAASIDSVLDAALADYPPADAEEQRARAELQAYKSRVDRLRLQLQRALAESQTAV